MNVKKRVIGNQVLYPKPRAKPEVSKNPSGIFLNFPLGKKERFVRICPKCGSADITRPVFRVLGTLICRHCKYKNPIFPEIEISKIGLFRKELKR